jgi:fructokinase
MTLGLLAGRELDRINDHANRVAAFVCSQAGAMPELPDHLRRMEVRAR